jgi:hypothetical protein
MGHGDLKVHTTGVPPLPRRIVGLALGLALWALFVQAFPRAARASGPPDIQAGDPLPRILEKAQIYCRKLGASSLHFTCREKIDERQYSPPQRIFSNLRAPDQAKLIRVTLEYDYQLVRKGESIEEKRILLKENNKPRNEPDAVLKTKLYKHKNLVFGPGALLSEYWQTRHAYTYLGEEKVDGEKTFLIEASPAGEPDRDLVYGKAWIRQKDFAIVKIEWDQRCLGNYSMILGTAKALGHEAEPRISVVGTYGLEKNGIRFPDRLTIREEYTSTRGIFRVSETKVLYTDYKFFIVETEVTY